MNKSDPSEWSKVLILFFQCFWRYKMEFSKQPLVSGRVDVSAWLEENVLTNNM